MEKVLIIADDLTGANANCALMKKIGLNAMSYLGYGDKKVHVPERVGVIACTTNSRAITPDMAKKLVKAKLKMFEHEDIGLYSKRIDSTLRGNMGSEIQAYQEFFGHRKKAFCVPAFPASGRMLVDDKLYVNGTLLLNTDAAKDPKMPVISNKATENLKAGYEGRITHIGLDNIEKGVNWLTEAIIDACKSADMIVFDSITDEHIRIVAEASSKSGVDFIAVDPGPFTSQLTSIMYKKMQVATKALAVVGSVTELTIRQLEKLKSAYISKVISVDAMKLMTGEGYARELRRCDKLAGDYLNEAELLIITTTPSDIKDRLNLKSIAENLGESVDEISLKISSALAEIAKEVIIHNNSLSGVFSSGGDITVALAESMQSQGIEIKDEVMPLAAYGRLIGGLRNDLKIVSKGGMVGSDDAMIQCIERILKLEEQQ